MTKTRKIAAIASMMARASSPRRSDGWRLLARPMRSSLPPSRERNDEQHARRNRKVRSYTPEEGIALVQPDCG
jgi:hypothetical protein